MLEWGPSEDCARCYVRDTFLYRPTRACSTGKQAEKEGLKGAGCVNVSPFSPPASVQVII